MTGLYVHIPYCHAKCAYCDFYSTPKRQSADALIDALCREWDLRQSELPQRPSTLYLGGGTPSILTIGQLTRLAGHVGMGEWVEATIECNPEDVTPQWIAGIKASGFNRVSMGVQSLDDAQLRLIGRRHSAAKAVESARMLMESGLKVSLDLIYGLPTQTVESWNKSLDGVLSLHPHHLSAYLLSYEQGTRLWAMLQVGKVEEASDELASEMYALLCQRMLDHGYQHYEVSNFATDGNRAVHNSNYWNGSPYLGLGPGAHSYDGSVRRFNPSSIAHYLDALSSGRVACEIDVETRLDRFNDMIITRLRTPDGISLSEVRSSWGDELVGEMMMQARPHIEAGTLARDGDRLYIPEREWLRSDAVMRDLIRV